MSPLIIRQNLSVPDPLSHFSSLWTIHSDSLATPWLTDLRLVAGQQVVWVHRAVLLPLCPFLAILVKEADSEGEPLLLLPDFPLELIQSFVKLVYQGYCPLTKVTSVEALLKLLAAVGFDKSRLFKTNSDGLQLSVEAVGSVGDSSNESQEVATNSSQKSVSNCVNSQEASKMSRGLDYNSNDEITIPTKFTVVKEVTAPTEVIQDIVMEEKDPELLVHNTIYNRKSTDKKHFCQFCDFKCRFFRQLVNHSNTSHAGSSFNCDQCSYEGTKLMGVILHKKQVHTENILGDFECGICGFKVTSQRKLIYHKKRQHSTENEGSPSTNAKGKYTCFRCPFRTMYKPNLMRHVTTYHKVDLRK